MSGVLAWGYDTTNKVWLPIQVDSAGRLKVDMSAINLDDLGNVSVPSPTDGYIVYWDAATSLWKCKALPAAAWAAITGKPTSPSLEELATEHDAAGLHTGMIVLADADIPAGIARDAEVATALSDHTALPSAHHTKYTDAEAKAAAVLAGAITDAETKAPTHDAVYDVKATADGAIPKSLLTERGSVIFRNASAPAELLHGTVGQVLQSGGHGADPSWAAAPGGTKIQDADADTKVDVEESADEDKIRMDVKGVEAFLLNDAGVLTLAKQSAARAYLLNQQTIPTITLTKVTLDTESYDVQSEFAANKFTAKTAGAYLLIGKIVYWYQDVVAAKMYVAQIYKNGVVFSDMWMQSAITGKALIVLVVDVAVLAVNDYIELYAYHETGVGCRINNGESQTSLTVVKVA